MVGDLQKAINLYKAIASTQSTNRRTTAQALANLGRAYEKLGASDTVPAYQRVVREFADQALPLGFAQDRLMALSNDVRVADDANVGVHSLIYPDLPFLRPRESPQYDVSPDGQQIVMRVAPDRSDSLLGPALTIATSGGAVLRTLVAPARQPGRLNPRWSPDGKYIAYIERAFIDSDTAASPAMMAVASR